MFPNPASDVVSSFFPTQRPCSACKVLGMDGRLVMTLHPDNGTSTFP